MTLSFNVLSKVAGLIFPAIVLLFSAVGLNAQSTLQEHPTPIVRNELVGTIRARDLGDARLTTYYYWFEGPQADFSSISPQKTLQATLTFLRRTDSRR